MKTICKKCTMKCIQNEKSLNTGINKLNWRFNYMFSDHKPGHLLYGTTNYLLSYRVQSLLQVFIIFISRWMTKRKREIVWINTGVNTRRREGGFMDISQRKLLLPLNLNQCTCKMARNQTYPWVL